MTIISAHKSDVGRRREQNEDYVWVDEEAGLYILADGMGGHEAGDVASRLASTTAGELIVEQLHTQTTPLSTTKIKTLMITAIDVANKTVVKAAQEAEQRRSMGTTIVIVLMQASVAYISHIGDSRAYLIRNSTLEQLTEDDTWGAQLAKTSSETDDPVPNYLSHILTQAIGQDTTLEPSFIEVKMFPNDWLLLGSDGLWNMVANEQTLTVLQQAKNNPNQAVEDLINAANQAGGKDNITVIAVKMRASENQKEAFGLSVGSEVSELQPSKLLS